MADTHRPLVSVIIPCYNQARLLSEAIDSALAQTYPNLEVIVIDDGSTDDTAEVAARYGNRIRFVRQANAGLPAARNRGIAESRGSIIGLLDADDRWLPANVDVKVPAFLDQTVGAVHSSYRKFPDGCPGAGVTRKIDGAESDFHELLMRNSLGAPMSVMFRRTAFEAAGRFDPTFRQGAEDWDLWLRIAACWRIVGMAEITAEYRLSPTSMSRDYNRMYRALRQVVDKNRWHHRGCGQCAAAARMAYRRIRSYYRDAATRDAWRARGAGRPVRYLLLRTRGILRDPRCVTRILPALAARVRRAV